MIAIIDYSLGNVKSVLCACKRIGLQAQLTYDAKIISNVAGIILPGVGSFFAAMYNLAEFNLIDLLRQRKNAGVPILGICLGMQILFEKGNEGGEAPGLGWLKGSVGLIPTSAKLPHMGWNTISCGDVYFDHSYMAEYNDETIEYTEYGGVKIPAIVGRDNVTGCQFHPEKSGMVGESILRRWAACL